jgi:hypothetical protein
MRELLMREHVGLAGTRPSIKMLTLAEATLLCHFGDVYDVDSEIGARSVQESAFVRAMIPPHATINPLFLVSHQPPPHSSIVGGSPSICLCTLIH